MDADYLAERIIKDLDGIFEKDPDITDFEILPVEVCTKNKCPVIHVAHQLGLESWCVKHVFQYTYKNILDWRNNRQQNKFNNLLGWTRALLLVNPDIQVAWNIRKELVESEKQDIQNELKFSAIALSRKPKSAEVLIHRRWLLTTLMKFNNSVKMSPSQADVEFQICNKAAEGYAQNYYAWSHRIWVVQQVDMSNLQLARIEMQNSDLWIQKHISDHSGIHYRQFLLNWLIKSNNVKERSFPNKPVDFLRETLSNESLEVEENIVSLLLSELESNSDLITFYEGHESLWYHRRFILHALKSIVPMTHESPSPSSLLKNRQTAKRTKLEILKERFNLAGEEFFLERIRGKMKKENGEVSNCAQNIFLEKHIQWLRRFLAVTMLKNEEIEAIPTKI